MKIGKGPYRVFITAKECMYFCLDANVTVNEIAFFSSHGGATNLAFFNLSQTNCWLELDFKAEYSEPIHYGVKIDYGPMCACLLITHVKILSYVVSSWFFLQLLPLILG